jgi:hypothetical protein
VAREIAPGRRKRRPAGFGILRLVVIPLKQGSSPL